jgi:hypothetical protein
MKPTTRLKLENVIRRLIREESRKLNEWGNDDEMDREYSSNQYRKLSPDEKKVAEVLQGKYSKWFYDYSTGLKSASSVRQFLMSKEPDLVADYTKIRLDDVIDYIS